MAEPFSFFLITDTHIFARALGTQGEAFEKFDKYGSTCHKASGALFDAAAKLMLNDGECNTVLVCGDISDNGQYLSNIEASGRLKALQDGGKRLIAITATHDYTSDGRYPDRVIDSFSFDGGSVVPARGTKRSELDGFYGQFGKDGALSVHADSGSYCVQLQEGYRLLCLNDDGDGVICGYSSSCMDWIHENITEAQAAGDFIFAMTHHPVVPPSPVFPLVSKRDMLKDYEAVADTFAKWGLTLIFTGHTHVQCIRSRKTPCGRTFYDVGTGALVSYPVPVRKVEISQNTVKIKTLFPETFEMDSKIYSVSEYTKKRFDSTVYGAIDGARHDIDRLAAVLNGLSIGRKGIDKHKKLVKIAGFTADKITVGTVDRILLLHSGVRRIKKVKLKDLLADCFRGFYAGERFVKENSEEHRFLRALTERGVKIAAKAKIKAASGESSQETAAALLDSIVLPPKINPNNTVIKPDT